MIDYVENEKKRLLNSMVVENFINEEYKIEIENISLKVDKYLNMTGHSFTIYTDIKMDIDELKKYDKKTSKITIKFTVYGKYNKIVGTGENTIYFDGGLFDTEFKGSRTTNYEFNDFILKDINKIKMQIDADLNEISTMPEDGDNIDTVKVKLLNSIETNDRIEREYDIKLENFGIKIDIENDSMIFYADTSISSLNWSFISFKCVLYDKDNSILDMSLCNIHADLFTGIDTLDFSFFQYYNNIAKVKIFPSTITPK